MSQLAIIDIEGPLRDWLKAQPELANLSGQRVFLGAAERSSTPIDYWLEFSRIGGGPEISASPLDMPLLSFHCYGRTRKQASDLAHALANLLMIGDERGTPPVDLGPLTVTSSRVTLGPLWQPDSITSSKDIPRYIVDAQMFVRPN